MADRRYVIDVHGRNRLWRAHGSLDCVLAELAMVETWRTELAAGFVLIAHRLIGAEAKRYTRPRLRLWSLFSRKGAKQ